MRRRIDRRVLFAGLVALGGSTAGATFAQSPPEAWQAVTAERVARPEAAAWTSYRRTYDATAFSPLRQIDRRNVGQLRPVWSFAVPDNSRWAPEPLVVNGMMYFVEGGGRVVAMDAARGDVLWVHERRYPADIRVSQAFNRSRGVAIYDDVIYWGTADTHLLALDARTGKLIWEVSTGDYHGGEGHNHPPLVAEGKVFIGHAGGDRGAQGRLRAYDAKTGKLLWTTYTAPRKGDPGYESWAGRDKVEPRGAAPWNSISYDPELRLVYFGTGQPTPWSSPVRGGGDALYAASAVALDAATGKMRWYFQMAPADNWDRAVYENMLVDLVVQGRSRKAVILTSKVGWGVVLDRANGQFLSAFRTAYDNTITGWTPKGRPIYDPALIPTLADVGSGKTFEICPHYHGARNLQAPSYSAETGLYYLGINNTCMDARLTPVDLENLKPGMIGRPGYSNRELAGVTGAPKRVPGYDYVGEFVAFNPVTGARAWTYRAPGGAAMTASALATAGGIVFGGAVDRQFFALDAASGALLWQTRLNGDVSGAPVTFEIGGRQYVAVGAGGKPAPSTSYAPLTNVELSNGSGAITVFALPDARDSQARRPADRVVKQSSGALQAAAAAAAPAPQPAPMANAPTAAAPMAPAGQPSGSGLFTARQAAHGEAVFSASCAACHRKEDQTGAIFRGKWGGGPVAPLFDLISTTMPLPTPGGLGPGGLGRADYAAIIAFMLKNSGYAEGRTDLPADSAALASVTLPR